MVANEVEQGVNLKKDIEFMVDFMNGIGELNTELIVHEWPKIPYVNSRYGDKEPLHINVCIKYDHISDTYSLGCRKEIDKWNEGYPIEEEFKISKHQKITLDSAIDNGKKIHSELEIEVLEHRIKLEKSIEETLKKDKSLEIKL